MGVIVLYINSKTRNNNNLDEFKFLSSHFTRIEHIVLHACP